jgi:hypothetical protein
MNFLNAVKNNFILLSSVAIEKKIDGREITEKLDKALDEKLGKKVSEKMQRGPITNLLFEMLEGLYSENKIELSRRLEEWIRKLKKNLP